MESTIHEADLSQASERALAPDEILPAIEDELRATRVIDMHTHLFMPSLGTLNLWGIDELITYHYLQAELFRSSPTGPNGGRVSPAEYDALSKPEQADLIWRTLFVENPPVSEATRGVFAVLDALGIADGSSLVRAREYFRTVDYATHLTRVLELGGVSYVVMTNDPLDPAEAPLWERNPARDLRFLPVLRLDRILNKWASHWKVLASQGYRVDEHAAGSSVTEVRRFVDDWCARMRPVYMAVSLPDTFHYPEDSVRGRLLAEAVLPACREFDIPLSLMIGVRYQVNPALGLAGDGAGKADLRAVERMCLERPGNRFFISVLSRENQHELCVYARKFANLMPFGCWWFLNNGSIVEEITRERLEMLGTSFIPQHSDARVLEQLIYKWRNTRRTLAPILAKQYLLLAEDGRPVTRADIRQDIVRLFRGNFQQFAGGPHV
jgi:hypothetical protein